MKEALAEVGRRWLPRLLTQVCRDPHSSQYGCFDRDWWHYRIRDFASIILQQGGTSLAAAAELAENQHIKGELRRIAAASCAFWNRRVQRFGAFEEYYPWEQGYPPVAFSTLGVLQMLRAGIAGADDIRPGIEIAVRQLLGRFESQAANQQVAGLAALAWARKHYPHLVPSSDFDAVSRATLKLQAAEGWFQEYGGPDLGYLSVTIDCLWDLYDATGDERYHQSIERAITALDRLTASGAMSIGMHNARNTDYLVPYGVIRAGHTKYFTDAASPGHFLAAIDDRYICHYIGRSLYQALVWLERNPDTNTLIHPPESTPVTASGHVLGEGLLLTVNKGGILTYRWHDAVYSDFGWIIEDGGRQWITHWWSDTWGSNRDGNKVEIEGPVFEHSEKVSTPAQHMALRVLSLVFGRRLIGTLKKRLIFRKQAGPVHFRRHVTWGRGRVEIIDTFEGLTATARLIPAPRTSKRHVASADSFHLEDLLPVRGFLVQRAFDVQPNQRAVTTTAEAV